MNKFNIVPKDVLGRNTTTNYMVMKLCYQINKLSSDVLLQKNIQTNEMENTSDKAGVSQEVTPRRRCASPPRHPKALCRKEDFRPVAQMPGHHRKARLHIH